MAVLYIKEQGAMIQKRDQRVIVSKAGKTLLEIPIQSIENIALVGNVQMTTQVLHVFMESGIDINYFTRTGKYLGQTAADKSKNIFLRFAQYDLYKNEERRLQIAKCITKNKIENQICMIQRHRWEDAEYDWKSDVKQLERLKNKIEEKKNANEIMGIEGMCSNIYFGAFGQMFHCDFSFSGRNRRPPRDPINALISLGYTFLTKEVSTALEAESFEMYLAFLHGIRYGRKSLPLDMVEEFRQPIVDQFVVRTCNKRMINQFDFEEEGDCGTQMNEEGFKKFCVEFERWMTGANKVNYRNVIKKQAMLLKKAVMNQEEYIPYKMEMEKDVSGEL